MIVDPGCHATTPGDTSVWGVERGRRLALWFRLAERGHAGIRGDSELVLDNFKRPHWNGDEFDG